ncbi:MAG: hypothetical protein ACKVT0_13950 [Planctomycetaceae bacterium]
MLRATFFACGLFVFLVGVQFLAVDKMILHGKDDKTPRDSQFRGLFTTVTPQGQRVFDPQDWSAFALMSVGSVTMLYAAALPRRKD